jgi:hypothetical protein
LRAFLKQELPEHMLPASIFVLETLPLSPTGKVDRAKLPLPAFFDAKRSAAPAKPRGEIEAALMKIWCEVLGRESVGIEDNFFDCGGTSLQLIQVHATIRTVMNIEITVVDLFQYPRISALAASLSLRASMKAAAPPMSSAQDRARRQHSAIARARSAANRIR